MESVREYILSVICVGTICTLLQLLITGSGSVQAVVKFISGIVLSVCVISPLLHLEDLRFNAILDTISTEREWIVQEGRLAAENELSQILKSETQTYIINRAKELGMVVQVDVTVSDDLPPVPESVTIIGVASPYGKRQLSQFITTELGVEKEKQKWSS